MADESNNYELQPIGDMETETPIIKLESDMMSANIDSMDQHDALLRYLMTRLESDKTNRSARLARMARIDKSVSTWQKLSPGDSQRAAKTETTGKATAININLPLTQTHLDDLVSFYAGIYSPASGAFYQIPKVKQEAVGQRLVDKLNTDAETTRYYSALIRALRSLVKYNLGGLDLAFGDEQLLNEDLDVKGKNHGIAINMYNFLWDPLIDDPSKIRTEAEWSATVAIHNRMWLIRRERSGLFAGVDRVVTEHDSNGKRAVFYRNPPSQAGVTAGDASTGADDIDWASYGQALGSDDQPGTVGYEVVKMYCWLNPRQFKLGTVESRAAARESNLVDTYELWKFFIADGKVILHASPVQAAAGDDSVDLPIEIPHYVAQQTLDEMGTEQRSTAELMHPFQTYASFLLNSDVAATRSNIYGLQVYDSSVVDISKIPEGDTVARIPSKQPGRDVRTALMQVNGMLDTGKTTEKLQNIMSLAKEFFPSQALPSQIAGIDRAVTNQVSAVMQGISRRLHTTVQTMDNDLFGPFAQACYRNIVRSKAVELNGLSDEDARAILSSGLAQLNREMMETAFRQILFAIMQNPEANQIYDLGSLLTHWGSLLNMSVDIGDFVRPPQPQQAGGPNAEGATTGQAIPGNAAPGA